MRCVFKIFKHCLAMVLCGGLLGCLTTRAELKEAELKRMQVSAEQEQKAQEETRFDEYDSQFRGLQGRIDVLDNQMAQLNSGLVDRQNMDRKQSEDLDKKLKIYEDALHRLEKELQELRDEVQNLKSVQTVAQKQNKNYLSVAEDSFSKKEWKKAISDYDNYRKENPKGKSVALATYKMGLAFWELNMKDAARFHFEEVITQFPSSKEAKKASQKLKSMK